MSEQTRRERWAAGDAARAEGAWGMYYVPEADWKAPEQHAADAAQRGDRWFTVDVVTTAYEGQAGGGVRTGYSRIVRSQPYDHVGAIERQGWEVHSMSSCFVQRGSRTDVGETVHHGDVVVTYLFRRTT